METSCPVASPPSTSNSLAVLTGNVRGICNKFNELQTAVHESRPDIIALTESWLNSCVLDAELSLEGYELFRTDRSHRRIGGGVMIYCRVDLKPLLLNSVADPDGYEEFLSVRIHQCGEQSEVAAVYRSPNATGNMIINQLQRFSIYQNCLIMGDFNCPGIDWENFCLTTSDTFASNLLELSLTECLKQVVQSPTRIMPGQAANILDLIFTHDEDLIVDIDFREPLGSSDHLMIKFSWQRESEIIRTLKPRRNVWKADIQGMSSEASLINWVDIAEKDLEQMWSIFTERLQSFYARFTPLCKRYSPKQGPPWLDKELKCMMKRRKRAWDAF